MKRFAAAIAVLSLSMTGACATDVHEEPEFDDEDLGEYAGMDPETTFFSKTTVRFNPDGSMSVFRDTVSLAQQIREREAEEAGITLEELYAKDASPTAALGLGSCGSNDLRMYSSTSYVGHELCLTGTGTAALHTWWECVGIFPPNCQYYWGVGGAYWDIPVRSYKPGSTLARFTDGSTTWTNCSDSGSNVANFAGYTWATHVGRDVACDPE